MKRFNTAGTCRPNEHYMVDITERLEIIRKMVAQGDYFCINRGRQYGKTTTLRNLKRHLEDQGYSVFYISFENYDEYYFETDDRLGAAFLNSLCWCLQQGLVYNTTRDAVFGLLYFRDKHEQSCPLKLLSQQLQIYTSTNVHPVVLLIDEVDQASSFPSFIKLLGVLRDMYIQSDDFKPFQSVILSGVYDIKNLKLKMRPEDQHQYNSPWNIAVPFDVDMSLSAKGIADMLAEYKTDHNLTFDEVFVAQMIRDYTAGYPFLVSRICQIIDTQQYSWDKEGVLKAVNAILVGDEPFWKDAKRTIENDEDLKDLLQCVIEGQYVCYEPYAKGMKAALEHGFIKRTKTPVEIASPLHESYLLSFCFRSATKGDACQSKNKTKQSGLLPPVELNGRTLIEAIV